MPNLVSSTVRLTDLNMCCEDNQKIQPARCSNREMIYPGQHSNSPVSLNQRPRLTRIVELPRNYFDAFDRADPKLFALIDSVSTADYKVTVETRPNIEKMDYSCRSNNIYSTERDYLDLYASRRKELSTRGQEILDSTAYAARKNECNNKLTLPPNNSCLKHASHYVVKNYQKNSSGSSSNHTKHINLSLSEFEGLFEIVSEEEHAAKSFESIAEMATKFPEKCLIRSSGVLGYRIIPYPGPKVDQLNKPKKTPEPPERGTNVKQIVTIVRKDGDSCERKLSCCYQVVTRKFVLGEILYLQERQFIPTLTQSLVMLSKRFPGLIHTYACPTTPFNIFTACLIKGSSTGHDDCSNLKFNRSVGPGLDNVPKSRDMYLKCADRYGEVWFLPFATKGTFTPFAKRENISGVHSLSDLVHKFQMPIKARLIGYDDRKNAVSDLKNKIVRCFDEKIGDYLTVHPPDGSFYEEIRCCSWNVGTIFRLLSLNREPEYNVYFLGSESIKNVKIPYQIAQRIRVDQNVRFDCFVVDGNNQANLSEKLSLTLISCLEILYHSHKLNNTSSDYGIKNTQQAGRYKLTSTPLMSVKVAGSNNEQAQAPCQLKAHHLNAIAKGARSNYAFLDDEDNQQALERTDLKKFASLSTIYNSKVDESLEETRNLNNGDNSLNMACCPSTLRTIRSDETYNSKRYSSETRSYLNAQRLMLSHLATVLSFKDFVNHLICFKSSELSLILSRLIKEIISTDPADNTAFPSDTNLQDKSSPSSSIYTENHMPKPNLTNQANHTNKSLPAYLDRTHFQSNSYSFDDHNKKWKHKLKLWLNKSVATLLNCRSGSKNQISRNARSQHHTSAQNDIFWCY